ncbi:DUF4129 domain-containing protein [Microbacterium sp. Leaf159]|uniref:DUF4129 domain-containing protein n=1 Tax=Microbacterium sp. Leaf159 TaxID=1736279 RepID=UPI0009EC68AF|nr:DUF4129 domain-containing protein [Microbacterium sp. Leaf159]
MPSDRPTTDARRGVRRLGLVSVVAALFLIVMIAAAIQGAPTFRPSEPVPPASEPPAPTTAPGATGLPEEVEIDPTSAAVVQVFAVILMLLVVAGVIALLVIIVRALLRAWRNRPTERRDGAEVAADVAEVAAVPEPEVVVEAIRRGIAGALQAIDERALPTDAVIAAWVGLEESAADAGVTRAASETPGEFALRVITRRSGIEDDASELLTLFERVRFGAHEATESERHAARAALRRIEEVWR